MELSIIMKKWYVGNKEKEMKDFPIKYDNHEQFKIFSINEQIITIIIGNAKKYSNRIRVETHLSNNAFLLAYFELWLFYIYSH